MERETFFSGYCRGMDASRMVTVITEENRLTETDCAYGTCPYAPECQITGKINALLEKKQENLRA